MRAAVKTITTKETEHQHSFHQIVLGLSGFVEFTIADQSAVVSPALGCLIPANIIHQFIGSKDSKVLVIDIDSVSMETLTLPREVTRQQNFDERQEPEESDYRAVYARNCNSANIEQLFYSPQYIEINSSFRGLYLSCAKELGRVADDSFQRYVAEVLMRSAFFRFGEFPVKKKRVHHRIDLDTLEKWVINNITKKIVVTDLAKVMCMSTSHFHTCFYLSTGKTPHQFITGIRLQQALEQVRNTSLSFSFIADETGFSTQSAMTNAFQKHFGTSPMQLRRRGGGY